MKWKMDNGENFLAYEGICKEFPLCKIKAVNGVTSQKPLKIIVCKKDVKSAKEVSCDEDLKTVRKLIFTDFNNVTDLNMMENSLEQLPYEIDKLHMLQTLNLSCNSITSISESTFSSLQCLKILNLRRNTLHKLPGTVCSLRNLKILDVSENNLSFLPDDIGQLRRLEVLDVSRNTLQTLPTSVEHICVLHTLNVSYNNFEELPVCVVNLKNLFKLNLSHNRITSFDKLLRCCYKLVNLDLSYNNLTWFPSWLFEDHCMWLKELNLSHNTRMKADVKSSSFDTCIKYLRKQLLKSLKVSNCKLSSPMLTFLEGLQGLEVLDLGNEAAKEKQTGNVIWTLPSEKLSLSTRLRKLVMCNVGLTKVPEDLKGMMALDILDLGGNDLSLLPDSFCELKNLRHCILSNNQFNYLPSVFGLLTSLEELWLHGNKLSSLPESFANLRMLKVLDLYDNKLREVPACMKSLSSLQAFDLELNFVNMDDQLSTNTFFENYQVLKANLRLKLPKIFECRFDGTKPRNMDSDSECIVDSGDEELERISTSDCSETFPDPLSSATSQGGSEMSSWGDESEMDDNFDPNERAFLAVPSVVPTTRINPLNFPGNFCPGDMHFQGIYKSRNRVVAEPVESQFEDSPFDDTDVNPTNISYLLNEKL